MALRAKIILSCAQDKTNEAVARELGICVHTVSEWRRRFAAERMAGLVDAPRSGAPREISDQKVEEVVTKTLETTPPARNSLEQLADGQGSLEFLNIRYDASGRPLV